VHFPDAKTFRRLGSDPHWATVKRLTLVGEHGGVTPAMRNLREVGPLTAAQLAPLSKGSWKVDALDVFASPAAITALTSLKLPLTRLSVRVPATTVKLAPLKKASYFTQLRELELWLPSATDRVPARLSESMTALEALAPHARLRVGVESPAGRTGWVLQRDVKGVRTLVLAHPDERIETGMALAKQLGVKLDTNWQNADDWLHFGLGVHVDAN
jgi:hypothetical protein